MDASKLTNGKKAEVLADRLAPAPESGRSNAVRSEARKPHKQVTAKKAKAERPKAKPVRSEPGKLVCRYCGSDDLAPSFIKRRDRRCRKCFSKRYGSGQSTKKVKK